MRDVATAPFVRVVLRKRGYVIHDDILCRACYTAQAAVLAPERDRRRGTAIEVEPWTGSPQCVSCEADEALRRMGQHPDG